MFLQRKPGFESQKPKKPSCCQCTMPSMSKINALMIKNFIKMWRNIACVADDIIVIPLTFNKPPLNLFHSQLLFIFLLPAMQVIFFCVAIGRDPTDLPIAVVNNEMPNVYNDGGNCSVIEGCDFTNISCRYGKIYAE